MLLLNLCNVTSKIKKMTTIIHSATTSGYKIVHSILQNEYVQLSAQYLTVDFMIMALIIESKKILHKII